MPRKRVSRVSPISWEKYKNIINDFIDQDAGRQPFLWLRKINQPLLFGEDSGVLYSPVQLEGLFHYNYIKSWSSSDRLSISGELDTGNIVLYISANLLRLNGFLNKYGYWDYNWAEDKFILNGKVYEPDGDTQVSQANNEALLFFTILNRENPKESEDILNSYIGTDVQVVNNQGIWLLDYSGKKVVDICDLPLKISEKPDIPIKTIDGKILGVTK